MCFRKVVADGVQDGLDWGSIRGKQVRRLRGCEVKAMVYRGKLPYP